MTKVSATILVALLLALLATPVEAKRKQKVKGATTQAFEIVDKHAVVYPSHRPLYQEPRYQAPRHAPVTRTMVAKKKRPYATRVAGGYSGAQIVQHPSGCPRRAFCGCGTALHIFGAPVRSLWLARNWFQFPRAEPAPGMVAVRRHHVFAILESHGDGTVTAYDPNSGRGLTRIWRRSLAGYTVVRPTRA